MQALEQAAAFSMVAFSFVTVAGRRGLVFCVIQTIQFVSYRYFCATYNSRPFGRRGVMTVAQSVDGLDQYNTSAILLGGRGGCSGRR